MGNTGVRTRRRRAIACSLCRQKKLRCDRQQPCGSCARSKNRDIICTYATESSLATYRKPQATEPADISEGRPDNSVQVESVIGRLVPTDATEVAAVTDLQPQDGSDSSQEQLPAMRWHSTALENFLVAPPQSSSGQSSQTTLDLTTDRNKNDHIARKESSNLAAEIASPISALMVKTRYLSPSSWLYSTLMAPYSVAWIEQLNKNKNDCWQILQESKALSRRLKHYQILPWSHSDYGSFLPDKTIADVLIDNYLRTFETTHRILHVPSFKSQYEGLWDSYDSASTGFVIQVQLCLSLGALFYDNDFSLRPQVLQWIKEAGAWLDSSAKPRLDFTAIQTMCLHRIAREATQGTYGDRVWILSGSLIRAAMSIGLHREPTNLPGVSYAQAEMRRRLWATVLELTLGSCFDPGAAPMICLELFDCTTPSNFDDTQLDFSGQISPVPRGPEEYTDSSVQVALAHSLTTRLAIASFSTSLKGNDYQDVLRLSKEYTRMCDDLLNYLRPLGSKISDFQSQYCELFMSRYVFALHIPYMVVGTRNPAYIVSRKACVDAALNLLYSFLPLSQSQEPLLVALHGIRTSQPQSEHFVRLCTHGSGPYRSLLFQAVMIIAADLIEIINDSKEHICRPVNPYVSSNPLHNNPRALELLSILRVAIEWTNRRMRVGQDINKDHLFVSLAVAVVEALIEGNSVKEALEKKGKAACCEIKSILEELTLGLGSSNTSLSEEPLGFEDDFLAMEDIWFPQQGDFIPDKFSL